MKKVMLVGQTGSGKTTLIQRLEQLPIGYNKTQMTEYYPNFIDTPGEFVERHGRYHALITTSADADVIGLVQACDNPVNWYPPAFSSAFTKPIIGIVTKSDLAQGQGDIAYATEVLQSAGAQQVFVLSAQSEQGIHNLLSYITGTPQEEEPS